jgi:Ca-activated chloride channel family protein
VVVLTAITASLAQHRSESTGYNFAWQQEQTKDIIKIDTNMVQLDVMVIDRFNHPIFNLTKSDFTVFENKSQQRIESGNIEAVPVSFGLVIDTSESMRSKIRTVAEGAMTLINEMRPGDEAFIAQIKSKPDLVQEFTSDKAVLEKALRGLNPSGGTSLLDAVIATAGFAKEYGKQRRKALIVITDGLERNSKVQEKEVINAITENEVQVHMIGFLDEEDEPSHVFYKSPNKRAMELLSKISDDSGGRAYFPKDLFEMPGISAQISKDLRTQYIISYYPKNDKEDGGYRAVRVMVNQKDKNNKLTARTRLGYFSRNNKPNSDK